MKNLYSRKSLLKMAILGGASFCIVILFAACKNFLNAKETKSEIEKSIEYANASTYPIYIKYSGSNGIVKSPAGDEISKKVTDTFNLSFDPIGDYEFVYWKITDDATKQELTNGEYLSIASVYNSDTTCTFVKAPEPDMKLCLSPVVTERPQIVSWAPILSTEMSFKDAAIQVFFDKDMDDRSIYYDDAELQELMAELGIDDVNNSNLLKTKVNDVNRYYGYKKDGQTYFKNISIINADKGTNYLPYFDAPVFETKNRLVIKEKRNNYSYLDDYSQIMVNIGQKFFYTLNDKPITMSGSKKWVYQISDTKDIDPPVVNAKSSVYAVGKKYSRDKLSVYSTTPKQALSRSSADSGYLYLPAAEYSSSKIHLDLRARDAGNGLNRDVTLYFKRIYDSEYTSVTNRVDYWWAYATSTSAYDANYDCDFDLSAKYYSGRNDQGTNLGPGFPDGVYELTFRFADSVNNYTFYPDPEGDNSSWSKAYIFILDRYAPDPKDYIKIPYATNQGYFYYTKSVYPIDISKTIISFKLKGASDYTEDQQCLWDSNKRTSIKYTTASAYAITSSGYSRCLINVVERITSDPDYYALRIQNEDYAGNVSDPLEVTIPYKLLQDDEFWVNKSDIPSIVCSHEVTQDEYGTYMEWYGNVDTASELKPSAAYESGESGEGIKYPAYFVNWYEAIMYCNLRSLAEGLTPVYYLGSDVNNYNIESWRNQNGTNIGVTANGKYYYNSTEESSVLNGVKVNENANGYCLPATAAWETLAKCVGCYTNHIYAGTNSTSSSTLKGFAWFSDNSETKVHPAETKKPAWDTYIGPYDMSGNVEEWCFSTDSEKITKGGSYKDQMEFCAIANNDQKYTPNTRSDEIGFRVVRRFIAQ